MMITMNHCFIHVSITILLRLITKNNNNTLFLLHINIKSLPKNIDKLSHFISELKSYPDVIVITETKT